MSDNSAQRLEDAEENRKAYEAVMKVGAEFGVPFALALTMFFTNLVMANGVVMAFFAGAITYVAVYVIVKMFFSH